jgi:hypothetical protein
MIVGWSENYGSETKFSVPENATKQKGHSNFKGLKKNGDAGYRSPYLSHAKRALYHLSYIPILLIFSSFQFSSFCYYSNSYFVPCSLLCKGGNRAGQVCIGSDQFDLLEEIGWDQINLLYVVFFQIFNKF